MISEKNILTPIDIESTWEEPIPLIHEYERSLPYPIHCLPSLIQEAVIAFHHYGKQPLSLIACSALATVSLSCQSLANVARDRLLISPVSLYFLLIAESALRWRNVEKNRYYQVFRGFSVALSNAHNLTDNTHVIKRLPIMHEIGNFYFFKH